MIKSYFLMSINFSPNFKNNMFKKFKETKKTPKIPPTKNSHYQHLHVYVIFFHSLIQPLIQIPTKQPLQLGTVIVLGYLREQNKCKSLPHEAYQMGKCIMC